MLARQMEVYAGFLEATDHHVGRLFDALDDLGILDDTIVYYIIGDNGASPRVRLKGWFNEMVELERNGRLETAEFLLSKHRMSSAARRPTTITPSAGRAR